METITSPAILSTSGEIVRGESHSMIVRGNMERVMEILEGDEGFVTSTGRFVSREEGAIIAFASQQIKDRVVSLQSYHLIIK